MHYNFSTLVIFEEVLLDTIADMAMTNLNFEDSCGASLLKAMSYFARTAELKIKAEMCVLNKNSLPRGPSGPSSLAPATQDKMHPFIIIQWS